MKKTALFTCPICQKELIDVRYVWNGEYYVQTKRIYLFKIMVVRDSRFGKEGAVISRHTTWMHAWQVLKRISKGDTQGALLIVPINE